MKRITFFKCYNIDDAVRSGLQSFSKEAGYKAHEDIKGNEGGEAIKQTHYQKHNKPLFTMLKLLAVLKIFFNHYQKN